MMKSRQFGYLCIAFLSVLLTGWFVSGCSGDPKGPSLTIYAFPSIVAPGDEVRISIEATGKDGNPLPDNSEISLTTTSLGSFAKGKATRRIVLKTSGGAATTTWFAGTKVGSATISASSEFNTEQIKITIDESTGVEEKEPTDAGDKTDKNADKKGDSDPGNPDEVDRETLLSKRKVNIQPSLTRKVIRADGKDFSEIELKLDSFNFKLEPSDKTIEITVQTNAGLLRDAVGAKMKEKTPGSKKYIVKYENDRFLIRLVAEYKAARVRIRVNMTHPQAYGSAEIFLDIVELGSLTFKTAAPSVIGVRFTGNEVSNLTFDLKDTRRQPYPAGTKVYFSITNPIGGARVIIGEAFSLADGTVTTQLKSGTVVTTVSVKAKAFVDADPAAKCPASCTSDSQCNACGYSCFVAPGKTTGQCGRVFEATSNSIAIVGGRPSHRGMTFKCKSQNIGGLYRQVGANISSIVNTQCTVILADRFSNKTGFPNQVLFKIEGGTIDATATTVPAGGNNGATNDVGTVTVSMRTQNPAPMDVPPLQVPNKNNCANPGCTQPLPGGFWMPYNCTSKLKPQDNPILYLEPSYKDPRTGQIRNPRDGLVTILAYTNGEEAFDDTNGNGIYDKGEPFTDIGEPFLDMNDDGIWQTNEPFVDIPCTADQASKKLNGCTIAGKGNGKRDGPNGVWDENTLIWKTTWVVWTSCAKFLDPELVKINKTVSILNSKCDIREFKSGFANWKPALDKNGSFKINDSTLSYKADLTVHDINLNPLTPASTLILKGTNVKMLASDGPLKTQVGPLFGFQTRKARILTSSGKYESFTMIDPASFWGLTPNLRYSVAFGRPDGLSEPQAASVTITVESKTSGGVPGCKTIVGVTGTVTPPPQKP
jgi:hypothetical protein